MKKQALLVGLVAVALFAGIPKLHSQGSQAGGGKTADDQTSREIAEQINNRHVARARFDRNAYSTLIDPSVVFAEPGEVQTAAQLLAEVHPTVGYKMVVENESPKVTNFGQTAVAVYRQNEKEIYGEQSLTTRVMVVDTYIKKDGNWVLIAHVELPEPLRRKSVKVNPAVLTQYAGQYEYGPGFVDTISVAGGKLMAQETGDDKPSELQPLNEATFFVDGDDGLVIFEKDASGKVSRYVYRTKGQELIAKKIN
jgi:Domain of unknown function (DUF4440)